MNVFTTVVGLTMIFVMLQIVSFNVEGEGGLAATALTSSVSTEDSTLPVTTTSGFLSADYVIIESELICYTAITDTTFTGLTRGCRDTTPESHATGRRVYNEPTSTINQIAGFNIAETMSSAGAIRVVTMVPGMLLHALPRIVMWDYSYLEGNLFDVLPLVYLKYMFLYPLSAGFVLGLVFILINVFMGIARIFTG